MQYAPTVYSAHAWIADRVYRNAARTPTAAARHVRDDRLVRSRQRHVGTPILGLPLVASTPPRCGPGRTRAGPHLPGQSPGPGQGDGLTPATPHTAAPSAW